MEFYPMPLFVKIKTENIPVSQKWYKEKLDFVSVFDYQDANGTIIMSHLRRNKYQDLMLIQTNDVSQASQTIIINLAAENLETGAQKFTDVEIVDPLQIQPWNAREMTVRSLEGVLFTLTEPLALDKSFDEVMGQLHD